MVQSGGFDDFYIKHKLKGQSTQHKIEMCDTCWKTYDDLYGVIANLMNRVVRLERDIVEMGGEVSVHKVEDCIGKDVANCDCGDSDWKYWKTY